MATSSQRREAARIARGQSHLPSSIRSSVGRGYRGYGDRVLAGNEPRPDKESREGKQLARLASLADQGKIDAKYLAFMDYWYHDE